MFVALAVAEVGVPVAIVAWLAPRRVPLWAKWLVATTLYLAYASVVSLIVAPLPSALVTSAGAAYIDIVFLHVRAAEHAPVGLLRVVGKAWVGLAAIPAAVMLVFGLLLKGARAAVRAVRPGASRRTP